MNKPLVTIITPVYNCGKYIDETIRSVLEQNYTNIQFIIIDDASTDKPGIRSYEPSGCETIVHRVNKGEQETVNEGLKLVKGKYFMMVNADDPLLPGAVSHLVEFMEANPHILCAYPDWNSIGENGGLRRHVISRDYDFVWWVQHHTWLPSVGSIFRSTLLKTIGYRDTSFRWLGDADYWLRVGLAGDMAHVPLTLACWRNCDGQATKQKSSKRAREHIRVMQKFYILLNELYENDDIHPFLWAPLIKVEKEAMAWAYLVASVVTDNWPDKVDYIARAVVCYSNLLISYRFLDLLIRKVWYLLRR